MADNRRYWAMTEISTKTDSRHRIVLLDALRLLAALLVVCFHWFFRGPTSGDQSTQIASSDNIAMYGYIGVDWFFIISGFVIAWTAEGRTAVQFALARFIRIYPAFVTCMTVTFIGTLYFEPHFMSPGLKDWAANLLIFAPAFGSKLMDGAYWSIIIELIFYAWVFLFSLVGLFDSHRRTIAIVWLAVALINQHLLHSGALRLVAATEFAPWFIMGMMLHDVWKKSVSTLSLLVLIGAFLASCLTLSDQLVVFARDYGQSPDHVIVYAVDAIGLLLVIACIYVSPNQPVLSRWASLAGALSYPLYLLHQQLGYILIDRLAPTLGALTALLVTIVAISCAASIVAFLIEPSLRQKLALGLSKVFQGTKILAPVVARSSRVR
jgi:peptidoglycan/LPS O-acetylase OafA/YrhL